MKRTIAAVLIAFGLAAAGTAVAASGTPATSASAPSSWYHG